jgi:polar amino acid transport system substrate-binding protein
MKKITIFLMVAFLVLGTVGCGSNKPPAGMTNGDNGTAVSNDTTMKVDEIKKRGELIVGISGDFPPFESHKMVGGKDTIVGFDVDFAQAIADKLGVKLRFTETSFNGLVPMLQSDKVDVIISGMSSSKDRAKSVDFSDIYYSNKSILLVKKSSKITSIDDVKGKTIAAQLGSMQETAVKNTDANVKQVNLVTDAVMELANSKVDGALVDEVVAKKFTSNNKDLKAVYISEMSDNGSGTAAAVKKGNKDLVKFINGVLKDLKDNAKYKKMEDKWFGA